MYSGRYAGTRRRDSNAVARLVVAVLAFLLLAAIGVNMLLAGTGVISDSSEPAGLKSILLSFLWLAGAGLCALFAVECEHRLRGLPRGRVSREVNAARQGARAAVPGRWRTLGRSRYGPVSTLIAGVLFLGLGSFLAYSAVGAFADAAQSSRTQSGGLAASATVARVSNNQDTSCGRYSCTTTDTAQVAATLAHPVDGQQAIVINIPDNVSYQTGAVISVLVDPRQPGYAELPGKPYSTESPAVGLTAGAVLFLAVAVAGLLRALRMRRRGVPWYR